MITEQRVRDFINNDLFIFSSLDNYRSIPSLIDGLKDSQRKALYGVLKHGNHENKVSQLGAFAGLYTHYDHGEVSMQETITKLAQNFTGSNNINLFEPIGQFGSILSPEAGSPRYIFTKPSKFLRQYMIKEDDQILEHREDEGEKLEPLHYLPIVPMWIVNGSDGIGTGHASTILSRDPKKVSDLIAKMVKGVAVQQKTIDAAMTPYFEGWKGRVVKREEDDLTKWDLYGNIEKVNSTTLRITELPIGKTVDSYKEHLIKLMDENKIKDFANNSTEKGFDWVITTTREIVRKEIEELEILFKLKSGVGENVTLWDVNGKLKRFNSAYEALQEFVSFRVGMYTPRRESLLKQYADESDWLRAKMNFIDHWNNKIDNPHKLSKKQLSEVLVQKANIREELHDRLLSMQISSLTLEKFEESSKELVKATEMWKELNGKTTEQLYLEDLSKL